VFPLARTVRNPVSGEDIPMFVADYVLMEYGTGDHAPTGSRLDRDYAFAKAFDLLVAGLRTVRPRGTPVF